MTNQFILSQKKLFNKEKLIAIFALFIGLFALSFAAIFIKWSEAEISFSATVFNRLWIATVICGFWNSLNFIYQKLSNGESNKQSVENHPYTKTVIFLFFILGSTYLGFQGLWAWSITKTSIAISTVLHNLTPIFTTFIGWLFFNKYFDQRFLLGVIIAIAGMFILGIEDLQVANGKISGDIGAFLSAIFYAGYLLIVEKLRTKLSANQILMWGSFSGAIWVFSFVLFTGERLFPYSFNGWLAVICLAVIGQILAHGLIAYSLNQLSSGFVALFMILDPVLTAIEARIIFAEKLTLLDWIAFLLALFGIYLALSSESSLNEKKSI